MTFTLPGALRDSSDEAALHTLRSYFGVAPKQAHRKPGADFDTWSSAGEQSSPNRFSADDLLAVSFLGAEVPPVAAKAILRDHADQFSALLTAIGADRDLANEAAPRPSDWAGWVLMRELRCLPGVGTTTAAKLVARKRPRLSPIWDSIVAAVTGLRDYQAEPLRLALRADNCALQHRLTRLRGTAGLPKEISPLRIFDVICWMEGKGLGL